MRLNESGDKKTSMKGENNKVLKLALKALKWTDDAIQNFVLLESLPEPLDCKPGCNFCCYNLPMVTPPEALLMGHYVEQTFSDQKKKELADSIYKILKHIDGLSPYEVVMMRHELPCIFLENGMCSVYPVRPVICRTCTSTSAEHCKMIFESQNHRAKLRCYQHIREIFQTVQTDLIDSCRELGCQSDLVHVAEGLRDYFKHPSPVKSWLQGEIVFHVLFR
jgi:Fe-S-cluster containining protein